MQKLHDMRILEHVGLTRNEANVYVELLRIGTTPAKNLTKITNMHRTSVYGCLQRLEKKGLVSTSMQNGKTYFEAVEPGKLLSLLKEREDRLREALPELRKLKDTKFYTPYEVQYFKGKQGLKSTFDDILNEKKDYLGWGPERKIEGLLKHYFVQYVKARRLKKIHAKLIYFEGSRGEEYTNNPLIEIRYLKNLFYSPTVHRVYGDKVAIILLEDDPLCILIRNRKIADSYRKQFKLLWKISKK